MESVAQRVAKGAALLDELDPHWRNIIDWNVLDIGDNVNCIMGQFMGGNSIMSAGDFVHVYLDGSWPMARSLGFDSYDYDDDYTEPQRLTTEWRKYDPRKAEQTV